jgi:hypothetical protein
VQGTTLREAILALGHPCQIRQVLRDQKIV